MDGARLRKKVRREKRGAYRRITPGARFARTSKVKGDIMTKREKAIEIVKECDACGLAKVAAGVYLESSASMIAQAASWDDEDPGRALDLAAYPYWLTTDSGTTPIGITGADDTDLLDAIEGSAPATLDNGNAYVSLDNGNTLATVDDLTDEQIDGAWDALVMMMDDDVREAVHAELAPCSKRDFLARYMQLATDDLII